MFKKIAAVLMVVGLSLGAGSVSARMGGDKGMLEHRGHGGDEMGRMPKADGMAGRFKMMIEMLELNGEQRKAVEAIHFAHHKEVIRKEADIDVAEIERQEIMGKEPVNVEEAEKKIRAIADLRADLEIMHLKAKEAIKAKLTPEQLEKMKKHMAAGMEEKMDDMGGMAMGGCRMGGKSRKCNMMKDASGIEKAADADSAGKDAMGGERKREHARHH